MTVKVVYISGEVVGGIYNWPNTWVSDFFNNSPDLNYIQLDPSQQMVNIGWLYQGGEFLPPPDTTPTFGRIVTKLAFRRRFVDTERRAIKKAALGLNNDLTEGQWLDIASAMDDLLAAGYIHLDRPETVSFVQALEALTLIGVGRAIEVLAPPVWSLELLAESRVMFGLPPAPTDVEMLANGGKGYSTVGQFMADHPEYA